MIPVTTALLVLTGSVLLWDFLTTPKMTLTDEPNFYRLVGKSMLFLFSLTWFVWALYRS